MRKLIPLLLVVFAGCKMPPNPKLKQLQDTLSIVQKKTDFKPLDSAEAYNFINKYYLPRLDTLRCKRRLFIHPFFGRNFTKIRQDVTNRLDKQYESGATHPKQTALVPPDLRLNFNYHYNWNKNMLPGVTLITTDTLMSIWLHRYELHRHIGFNEISIWRNTFPFGYAIISYPLYNSNYKRLYFKECIVKGIGAIDGNTEDKEFFYQKTSTGWQLIKQIH